MVIYIITAAFIVLDFATGLVKAFKNKEFTSSVMREGLYHKAGSILIVVLGALADYAQGFVDIGVTVPVAATICSYIVMMEIGSIIENLCIINPRFIPAKIQTYFKKITEHNEKQEAAKPVEKEADQSDNVQGTEG